MIHVCGRGREINRKNVFVDFPTHERVFLDFRNWIVGVRYILASITIWKCCVPQNGILNPQNGHRANWL